MLQPKRFFILMCFVVVLALAGSVAGFILIDKQLKHKSQVVSTLIADRDVQEFTNKKLLEAKKSAQDVGSLSTLIATALPKQKKQESVVADILAIANASKNMNSTSINNINFNGNGSPDSLSGASVNKDIPGVYTYPFNIVVKTINYPTLIDFLARIEVNKRIMQVDQIQIIPKKDGSNTLDQVNLSLKTFIQP